MSGRTGTPIRVALIDDYEIVLAGLGRMLERYSDRIDVAEIDAQARVDDRVDVALYDTFAQTETELDAVGRIAGNPASRTIAVYTWNLQQDLIDAAIARGARGYLSKSLPAVRLVEALEAIAAGEVVVAGSRRRGGGTDGLEWPGRSLGLTDREAEILALITQGLPNSRIAELVHLSPNTVKTHIRAVYRKIDVTTRVEAVIWGTDNGFRPDHRSVDHWLGGD